MTFLNRRIDDLFVSGDEVLNADTLAVDDELDVDGRYRVTEFFCHDNIWKSVFSKLAPTADSVLMDLRGFSRQNAGCVFEIEELCRLIPLTRVTFLTNQLTDVDFMHQTIDESLEQFRQATEGDSVTAQTRTLRYAGDKSVQPLLRAVATAVAATGRRDGAKQ
jgi:hypothetical protein